MITLKDWLVDLSENYSVQHVTEVEGIVIDSINDDFVLVKRVLK